MTYPRFIFFGTGHFAEKILETLIQHGCSPVSVVSSPDKPVGRHQIMTPSAVKALAEKHGIPCSTPQKLQSTEVLESLKRDIDEVDVCVVADYGKILPQRLLDLCPNGFLNIHPSLLPLLRGASPLQFTLLENTSETGVTIIRIDAQMDHGPIVAVEPISFVDHEWPMPLPSLSLHMAEKGAHLLMQIMHPYVAGNIVPIEQDHTQATYTKMFEKKDGEISIEDIVQEKFSNIYAKFCAFYGWPGIFFMHNGKRIKINSMNTDEIVRVTPEGKTEIGWSEYVKYHPLG